MSRIQNKNPQVRHVVIDAEQTGRRIDNFLASRYKGVPKTRIYQMLRRGEIRINGGRVKQDYRLKMGDSVRIPPIREGERPAPVAPPGYLVEMVRQSVIYEDEAMIILNKPAGIVVHGGSGRSFGVIEILRWLRPAEKGIQLVHRLDQQTSGCLMIAKDAAALRQLHRALKEGKVEKRYLALLKGRLGRRGHKVELPLRKSALRSGERMVEVDQQGKPAITHFKTVRELNQATLAEVLITTGRTHQIRVHGAHIQHPIAGDEKYGDKAFNRSLRQLGLKRMFLHASSLRLPQLVGKSGLEITAPLPDDLAGVIAALSGRSRGSH